MNPNPLSYLGAIDSTLTLAVCTASEDVAGSVTNGEQIESASLVTMGLRSFKVSALADEKGV